jgi:head-tail adaptor
MRWNLRETVSLQRQSETADGGGGASLAWSEIVSLRCAVDESWARERLASSGLESDTGVAIRVRYRTGIDAAMRAVIASGPYAGTYNVTGKLVVTARGTSRPESLILSAERGVAV